MSHVSPSVLWIFGCRAEGLSQIELEHVLRCADCNRLLEQIEETLDEIAEEQASQTVN